MNSRFDSLITYSDFLCGIFFFFFFKSYWLVHVGGYFSVRNDQLSCIKLRDLWRNYCVGVSGGGEKGIIRIQWLWKYLCFSTHGVLDSFDEIEIPKLSKIKSWDWRLKFHIKVKEEKCLEKVDYFMSFASRLFDRLEYFRGQFAGSLVLWIWLPIGHLFCWEIENRRHISKL